MGIENKIDERIAKLQQIRSLLSDPDIFEYVKTLVNDEDPADQPPPTQSDLPECMPRLRGAMLHMAFQCVQKMTEPFTARELVDKMEEAGFTFAGNSGVSIQSPLKKLVKIGVAKVLEPGSGRRATIYDKAGAKRR